MQELALLTEFGLNEKEARTYLALLQLGTSTVKPIADRAGVKRTSIYNFIGRLVSLGLVSRTQRSGRTHYQAMPPTRLMELLAERTRQLESALPLFMGMFNAAAKKPRMHYFEGSDQMKNIVREEVRCHREALYIWPGRDVMEMIGGLSFMTEVDRARIKKGVHVRTIRFRDKDIPYAVSASGPKFLRELRYAPPGVEVSMGMGVYDTGKVGFFSSANEGFGILIESRELQQLMTTLYVALWAKALPAKAGEG